MQSGELARCRRGHRVGGLWRDGEVVEETSKVDRSRLSAQRQQAIGCAARMSGACACALSRVHECTSDVRFAAFHSQPTWRSRYVDGQAKLCGLRASDPIWEVTQVNAKARVATKQHQLASGPEPQSLWPSRPSTPLTRFYMSCRLNVGCRGISETACSCVAQQADACISHRFERETRPKHGSLSWL